MLEKIDTQVDQLTYVGADGKFQPILKGAESQNVTMHIVSNDQVSIYKINVCIHLQYKKDLMHLFISATQSHLNLYFAQRQEWQNINF